MYLAVTQNYEQFRYNPYQGFLGGILCQDGAITQPICVALYYALGGYSPEQLNKVSRSKAGNLISF